MSKSRLVVQVLQASVAALVAGCQCVPLAGPAPVTTSAVVAAAPPAPSAPTQRFTLAGLADYRGTPFKDAILTVYRLGEAKALGSTRTGQDGSFAVAVAGNPGDLLELVAYQGGHAIATIAFPKSAAKDASAYGRVALSYGTTIITGALADSYSDLGQELLRQGGSDPRGAVAKARGVFDQFVLKRDGALLAKTEALGKEPLPAAGPADRELPSYVQALKDHVRSVKSELQLADKAKVYRVQAAGDRSSAEDLLLIFTYFNTTYLGLKEDLGDEAAATDLPALDQTQLVAIEQQIQASKGQEGGQDNGGMVTQAVVVFFNDVASDDQVVRDATTDLGGAPPVDTPPQQPQAPPQQPAPPASSSSGGGGDGATQPTLPDVTASGAVKVQDGKLVAPGAPSLDN